MVRQSKHGRRRRRAPLATGYSRHGEAVAAEAIEQARATARAEVETAAREEIAAAYAAAVEAMVRAEVLAAEKVALAEAAAAEAVAEARVAVAEAEARAAAAEARVAATEAQVAAAEVLARHRTVLTSAVASADANLPAAPEDAATTTHPKHSTRRPTDADRAQAEASARAQISQLVSGLAPVELWVHTNGRTVEEATEAALDQLGVDEADAEIEVLAHGSRWLPGKVQIRARVRANRATR